ncbi:MAG: hypothetical protein ATN34_05205 [Epulopiscium sp. Nele67-Bin002]|nr:MAG: hypothetical protein ATN34_05205 [Epulopiscium sp. Nele67-Bin002]
MRLAICDDNQQHIELLNKFLTELQFEYNEDFEIYTFSSGEALCDSFKTNKYDLIFLDISMTGMDGIETARTLRLMKIKSLIIFVSSITDRMRELLGPQVVGFIDKPPKFEELKRNFQIARENLEEQKGGIFKFTIQNTQKFVYLTDIRYFEKERHQIKLATADETHCFTASLKSIWAEVSAYDVFIKPSRSFIVNLEYVQWNDKNCLKVDGIDIPIGRKFQEETLNKYQRFLAGKIRR